MSASEKLKALDAVVTERKAQIENALAGTQDIEALHALDALPQIVALVEAAQGAKRYLLEDANGTTSQSDYYGALADLDRSLTALEEALS